MENRSAQIILAVVCFLLGIMLVVQFRTHTRIVRNTAALPVAEQATIIRNLVDANEKLRKEVLDLGYQLDEYEMAVGRSELDRMVLDLNRLRIINGSSEVSGPGIEITVQGMLRPEDLQDLVNELRDAGAEAIAVNHHRVVINSSFTAGDGGVLMNGEHLLRGPFVFQAIGNSEGLESAMIRQGGLLTVIQSSRPDIEITVFHKSRLVLPRADRLLALQLARVPE